VSASLLVVAGEVSGDLHAGNLLAELQKIEPALEAFGVGGERLAANGLECVATTDELAHMGLMEVVRELPRIRGIMKKLTTECGRRRPDLAVLVDSPDFNLRLAARLASLDIPVVLYVSPQLWAWRRGRVKTVRRVAREVLCLLPFEVSFYRRFHVPARYVGHPLVDDVARDGLLQHEIQRQSNKIAMLPGSRFMEVRSLLPIMIRAAQQLEGGPARETIIIEAPGVGDAMDEVLREAGNPTFRRVTGDDRRRELASCALAWTASGTATLECALLDVPMIVGYRLHPISYAVARLLVRVPHVALVNLIAQRRLAPELIQGNWSPHNLAAVTAQQLAGGADEQRKGLEGVREQLGTAGASQRAAAAILEHLRSS
jgi:lipid-A-disaccharide synthase